MTRDFQRKKRIQKNIFSPLFILGLLFLFIILTIPTVKVYLKSRKAIERNKEIEAQIEDLRQRKAELEKEVARFETEEEVEEKIREKFDVALPGENVLKIIDKSQENDKINNNEEKSGFFGKIWNWIKEVF